MVLETSPTFMARMDLSHVDKTALVLFVAFFVVRYLRTVVGIYTYLTYRPKPVSEKPKYVAEDVTVVVPTTFKDPGELVKCLRCIVSCEPASILVVTSHANVELVKTCCALNSFATVKVLGVEKLNKRKQMLKALESVETDITVFADDDVFWPFNYLNYLLAIFENPRVGAGGTKQRVRRNNDKISFWNFLGICYLERRVWNNITTIAIDGSISTLSGRTAAYRTDILKTSEFFWYFENDSFMGRRLTTDDDKALTRYVYSHGWEIALQVDDKAVIETTLEDGWLFISQCIRWARGHWRGNLTVMANETYWRSSEFVWGTYVIYFGQFQTPALLVDGILFGLLVFAFRNSTKYLQGACILLGVWVMFVKMVELIPHFCRRPEDLKFLPVSILFSYLHGIINIYALCSLDCMKWGSQNVDELKIARAQDAETLPFLRNAMHAAEPYCEPTLGRLMDRDDYFSARPVIPSSITNVST